LGLGDDTKEINMPKSPSAYGQNTIATFSDAEDIATVFTCEEPLQKHLEEKLGLKPITGNGFGTLESRLYNGCLQPYN